MLPHEIFKGNKSSFGNHGHNMQKNGSAIEIAIITVKTTQLKIFTTLISWYVKYTH